MNSLFNLRNLLLVLSCFCSLFPIEAKAQLTPDNTLGSESSVVNPIDNLNDSIDGGAARGANLFHSFAQFNVGELRGVFFTNPAGIENIFTRVIGGSPSNILGTLGVLGNANLFLINPSGIFFGANARLDLGGSFFGSTADGLLLDNNGTVFSALNPSGVPLLTINVPIGLQYGGSGEGAIANQSRATNGIGEAVGLEVGPNGNLVLVGGNVNVDGGLLTASGGRVELGGLTGAGTVEINNDGSLSFPLGVQRGDVILEQWRNG